MLLARAGAGEQDGDDVDEVEGGSHTDLMAHRGAGRADESRRSVFVHLYLLPSEGHLPSSTHVLTNKYSTLYTYVVKCGLVQTGI